MKKLLTAGLVTFLMSSSAFAADKYTFDSSHSQIVFSYSHLGFSTTTGMFSGFSGEAILDSENPEKSSVTATMKTSDMITGWAKRSGHFMSKDFFQNPDELVNFKSQTVKSTGDKTADITGMLTLNGVTKSVVLKATLNKIGKHPTKKVDWAGFNATTTLKRTDFALGKYAPWVSDEVALNISVELKKAE